MSPRKCPECGEELEPEAARCLACGADARAGLVGRPAAPPEPEVLSVRMRVLRWTLELLPGLLEWKVAARAGAALVLSVLAIIWAVTLLGAPGGGLVRGLNIMAGLFIIVPSGLIYAFAWCWLLVGEVCMPQEAMVDFKGRHWIALIILTLGPLGGAFAVGALAAGL